MDELETLLRWLKIHVRVWKCFLEMNGRLRHEHIVHERAYQHFVQYVLPIIHQKVIQFKKLYYKQCRQEGTEFTVRKYHYPAGLEIEKHQVPENKLECKPKRLKPQKLAMWRTAEEERALGVTLILESIKEREGKRDFGLGCEVVQEKVQSTQVIVDPREMMALIDLAHGYWFMQREEGLMNTVRGPLITVQLLTKHSTVESPQGSNQRCSQWLYMSVRANQGPSTPGT